MTLVATPFVSQVNGFHFINRFDALPPIKLPWIGPIDPGTLIIGLCGGMSFAALDYYYHQMPIPPDSDPQAISQSLRSYLVERQLDSLSLFVLNRVIGWMLRSDADVLRFTGREAVKTRALLDRNTPVPLCLVRVAGLANPTANHQVVARAYEFDANNAILTLHLYDPNHPDSEPTINLHLLPDGGAANLSQSTGEPLRAFFVNPYQPKTPPA